MKYFTQMNPDVRKALCVAGIVCDWIFWPKESDYQRYDARQEAKKED